MPLPQVSVSFSEFLKGPQGRVSISLKHRSLRLPLAQSNFVRSPTWDQRLFSASGDGKSVLVRGSAQITPDMSGFLEACLGHLRSRYRIGVLWGPLGSQMVPSCFEVLGWFQGDTKTEPRTPFFWGGPAPSELRLAASSFGSSRLPRSEAPSCPRRPPRC